MLILESFIIVYENISNLISDYTVYYNILNTYCAIYNDTY